MHQIVGRPRRNWSGRAGFEVVVVVVGEVVVGLVVEKVLGVE